MIQPYLFFHGRCQEALDFYVKALGAKVEFKMLFRDSPEPHGGLPPDWGGKIAHAALRLGDGLILASDGMETRTDFKGFFLAYWPKTEAAVDKAFNALLDGGQVRLPPRKTSYSPRFGMLIDRFGVGWMIGVPGAEPEPRKKPRG